MRYLACVLFAFSVTGASGTLSGHTGGSGVGFHFPETDYTLDSYMYNESEAMSTIPASYDDYAAVDDFDPYSFDDAVLGTYFCWGVTTGAPPTALDLLVVEDNYGNPGGAPVIQETCSTFLYDSGYLFSGYTIWLVEMHPTPIYVETPCWLGSQRNDGSTWYVVGGITVSGSEGYRTTAAGWAWAPFSAELEPGDLFKVMTDDWSTPWWVSLTRTTWAGVKNSF